MKPDKTDPNQTEHLIPKSYSEALRLLENKPFLETQRYKEQQWRADRSNCHPDILDFEAALIKRFSNLGIPMFAHNMRRTLADQKRLFVQGVTKATGGRSPHNHGFAVDVVHSVYAWNVPKPCWDLIGHIGKEVASQKNIAIVWGGDWKFYDPAHWELKDWRSHVIEFE